MPPEGKELLLRSHEPTPQERAKNRTAYVLEEINKGKPVVALEYRDGIIMVTENPRSAILGKIFEIYDRIAMVCSGRYDEYENLRKQMVTFSAISGFNYSREDVRAKDLAEALAGIISQAFNGFLASPLRVDVLVVEVGPTAKENLFIRIQHNGAVSILNGLAVVGGQAEELKKLIPSGLNHDISLKEALKKAKEILELLPNSQVLSHNLEVAVLDRTVAEDRKFRKLPIEEIQELMS